MATDDQFRKKPMFRAQHSGREFEISEGGNNVGYYLFVFEAGRCTHDCLQDTPQLTLEFASEEFGVPVSAWEAVK